MRTRKMIVGYGTGRCGTKSLAQFLSLQPGGNVTHEKVALGWWPVLTDTSTALSEFVRRNGLLVGDVGFYWIQYLDLVLRTFDHAAAINIHRDLDEVIESFWKYTQEDRDLRIGYGWVGYPYDSDVQTKDALAFNMRRYRAREEAASKIYPGSIWIMRMEELNDPEALNCLLEWLGVPEEDRDLTPVRVNTGAEKLISRNAREAGRLFDKTFRDGKGVTNNDCSHQVS